MLTIIKIGEDQPTETHTIDNEAGKTDVHRTNMRK